VRNSQYLESGATSFEIPVGGKLPPSICGGINPPPPWLGLSVLVQIHQHGQVRQDGAGVQGDVIAHDYDDIRVLWIIDGLILITLIFQNPDPNGHKRIRAQFFNSCIHKKYLMCLYEYSMTCLIAFFKNVF